jgi:integrase
VQTDLTCNRFVEEGSGVITSRTLKRTGKKVYDVRLRAPDGRVYNRTFATKKSAEAFEEAERTDRRRGAWVDPRYASMTVSELATRWLASNPAKRSKTRARDESIIRVHVLPSCPPGGPRFGHVPIGSVTQPDIQGIVNAWAAKAQPRTVKRQFGVLRAIFAYAVSADFLGRTPCRDIKLPEVKPLRRRLPTPDQLAGLAAELGPHALMMWIGVLTGLRWGEVAGLRVGSVDLLRGELRVVEQRTRDLLGEGVTDEPKSRAGVRPLGIEAVLVGMISEHLARRGLTGADVNALVFVAERGGPLNYSHWRQRIWSPACARAGLVGLTFHDLRRRNATGMVADNVDVKTAMTRFGHSDVRLTIELYAQATTEADLRAAESLAARFLPRDERAMVSTSPDRPPRP